MQPKLETFNTPQDGIVSAINTPQGPGLPPKLQVVQKPTQVSASATNQANKPGAEALEQAGKFFGFGGKGAEQGEQLRKRMSDTANLLQTLEQNPQMGAGAELFQQARKLAETLGMPVSPTTSPTELASMQLGQSVINELGGLGAQISDPDRQFMIQAQGSITTDPAALQHLLLLRAKYLMQTMNRMKDGMGAIASHPSFAEQKVPFPSYDFNMVVPPKFQPTLDEMFQGRLPTFSKPQQSGPVGRPARARVVP